MLKRFLIFALLFIGGPAFAQQGTTGARAVTTCGAQSLTAGNIYPLTIDLNGTLCIPGPTATYFVQPIASDNHANIKNGAGKVFKISATNNSAVINYLRLYNAGTGFNGCNSATNLVYQMMIPASSGIIDTWVTGMPFATGISICVTSGYDTTDVTSATASAMSVNIGYK